MPPTKLTDKADLQAVDRPAIDRRSLAWFLGLTFLFDWGLVGGYLALGGAWEQPWATVVSVLFMLGPAMAAWIVQRRLRRRPLAELGLRWRPRRSWLPAWLGPLAFALATLLVGWLLPGVRFDPTMAELYARFADGFTPEQLELMRRQTEALPLHPFWLALPQALLMGATINALFGLGEELGWRGLMHELLRPLGFWRMSGLTGLVWGLWHAPLILLGHNYPDHPRLGVLMMIAWCLLLAPPFTWIRERTGSVVAAAVMHGVLNASAGLPLMITAGGGDLWTGVTGLAGFLVLGLIALAIALAGPPEPARVPVPRGPGATVDGDGGDGAPGVAEPSAAIRPGSSSGGAASPPR